MNAPKSTELLKRQETWNITYTHALGETASALVGAEERREVERLLTSGELFLAPANEIEANQKRLKAEMVEGAPLDITLDPQRSAVENAQKYFAEYRRAKDAAARVPERLQEVESDLAFANQVLTDLETAETRADIDAVVAEAHAAGLLREKKSDGRQAKANVSLQPRIFLAPGGFQVLVGRNARQNEQVTFERAGAEDLWLHARGASGAHVVILTRGADAPESTVEFAASLAVFYSDARGEAWVDVVVTPRKNVRRVSGRAARPGLVNVHDERVIRVRPVRPDDE